jgi:hypothetical protein
VSGCRAFILDTYISVLPQFQSGLHQIFTSRDFYVSQAFISYIVVTGYCHKALFSMPSISPRCGIWYIFALTFSPPKPVNNYDTFIVEKVSIQKLQINLAFFFTFPTYIFLGKIVLEKPNANFRW